MIRHRRKRQPSNNKKPVNRIIAAEPSSRASSWARLAAFPAPRYAHGEFAEAGLGVLRQPVAGKTKEPATLVKSAGTLFTKY